MVLKSLDTGNNTLNIACHVTIAPPYIFAKVLPIGKVICSSHSSEYVGSYRWEGLPSFYSIKSAITVHSTSKFLNRGALKRTWTACLLNKVLRVLGRAAIVSRKMASRKGRCL